MLTLLLLLAVPAAAQVAVEDARPVADTLFPADVTPGGAFLRSLAVPGWGQAATGAYSRASFYFLTEAASGLMLWKTLRALGSARDRLEFWEVEARREAVADGVTDPDSLQARIAAHPRVEEMQALEETRVEQREDWLAFGLFMLLLGGADAFVSAHLRDFPDPITVGAARAAPGQAPRVELTISLPMTLFR